MNASCSIRRSSRPAGLGLLLAAVVAALACARPLMPTPTLYTLGTDQAFDNVPEAYRNNTVDVLYVTDRTPSGESKVGPMYGYGRSKSLAFGSCQVAIGQDVPWEVLKSECCKASGRKSLPLTITQVREIARCPEVPFPVIRAASRPIEDPEVLAQMEAVQTNFLDELSSRLAHSGRKQVYVYVHGFNNTFEDAVYTSAELWHFLGRQGVPICYTWPAGRGLSGQGYVYDRESSEFTVFHLKQLLRALGRCRDVEKVHILAHSRGTDVLTSALRELNIEYKYADTSAREALKLGNVVLAAPDIDLEVFQQRVAAERIVYIADRVTIYTSPTDRALAMADILTLGISRIGQLRPSEMTPRMRAVLEKSPVTMVEALVSSTFSGHSYFSESPAVSSDLILLFRDNCPPGAATGRPLTQRIPNFYEIRDDYLRAK
jgi:esterase/lipase superfamily enzyme